MKYSDVNPSYLLEMESLSLMDYAKVTVGAREKQRTPNFYHTGYNFKYLMPANTDYCLSVPITECDTFPKCSTYHDTYYRKTCVTTSRIHEIQNNGEVWKSIPGNSNVLDSSYFVVGSGVIDSADLDVRFSSKAGASNLMLYYKLFISKKTNVLHCVFSSAVVFEQENLITLLTPVVRKLIETLASFDVEHICVSGHSMGAIQTVILAYVWESLHLHMDVFSKTTFIAFGPYKVLPTEWHNPQVRVYFTLSKGSIDPFSEKGNPTKIQYMNCLGLEGSSIKNIENQMTESGYAMCIGHPLQAGGPELHNLDLYIESGQRAFKRVQGGTRKRRKITRKSFRF